MLSSKGLFIVFLCFVLFLSAGPRHFAFGQEQNATDVNATDVNVTSTATPTSAPSASNETSFPTISPTSTPSIAPGGGGGGVITTIYETLVQKDLILASLVDAVRLRNTLDDAAANLTLFAPTNEAFQALHPDILAYLMERENSPVLRGFLLGHVAQGSFSASSLRLLENLQFENGAERRITISEDDEIFLDRSQILEQDIKASNGIIHTIDRIVNILTLAEALETFGPILLQALSSADLLDQMNGTTLFNPNFFAFASLSAQHPELADSIFVDPGFNLHLVDLLLAHTYEGILFTMDLENMENLTMANGENFTVFASNNGTRLSLSPGSKNGTATIQGGDFVTLQTVLHGIDGFLSPSFLGKTLVDVSREYTTTLASMIVTADMEDLLIGTFNVTLFAPTDDAFAAVDPGMMTFFQTEAGIPSLQAILRYHIVQGVWPTTRILTNMSVPSLYRDGAAMVDVLLIRGGLVLNDNARVLQADKLANTGIAHLIDRVLKLPPVPPPDAPMPPPPTPPPPTPTPPPVSKSTRIDGIRIVLGLPVLLVCLIVMV